MSDTNNGEGSIIVPQSGLISLDEARAAAEKRTAAGMGYRGLKRSPSRKEVGELALAIALDISERTYNAIAAEHAEQMEKLEAVCTQRLEKEIAAVRAEAEARTLRGRWRRLVAWMDGRRQTLALRIDELRSNWLHPKEGTDERQ